MNRHLRALAKHFKVYAAGTADPRMPGVEYFHIPPPPKSLMHRIAAGALLKLRLYEKYYWLIRSVQHCQATLGQLHFDAIVANDLITLPLALKLGKSSKVVFDAHEYSPREHEDRLLWRFFFERYTDYLCRTYLPKAHAMLTVCDGIAAEYRRVYAVDATVVTNAPPFNELTPSSSVDQVVRMIHHGNAMRFRRLENMIELMRHLDDRFRLDFVLIPADVRYLEELKKMAVNDSRIRFLPPVEMSRLVEFGNSYDVGLYLLEPVSFNNLHALPNKFFEFVQSRLALAIGPSPEMARIVREFDCGVVADDFSPSALARVLNDLDRNKIEYHKNQSHKIARQMSAEANEQKLISVVRTALNQ